MAKVYIPRGLVIASIGIILLVIGSNMFDNAYDVVEPMMNSKHDLFENEQIMQGKSVNSTIYWNQLDEHSVLLVHVMPPSGSINLQVSEPSNETFEKESKNGFVYHIIDKNPQSQGNYYVKISNLGNDQVSVNVILGEDPYLSGTCDSSNGVECYAIPIAIGLVIVGMLALIVGSLIAINDFRKRKKSDKIDH